MKSDLYNHGLTEEQFYAPFLNDFWVRPATWISTPEISQGQDVVYLLCKIVDEDQNWVFLQFESSGGGYTVDWGDGSTPETFSNGIVGSHNFNFADVDSLSVQPNGSRQALIAVTFNGSMTRCSFSFSDSSMPVGQRVGSLPYLEMKVASTSMSASPYSNFFNLTTKPINLQSVHLEFPPNSLFFQGSWMGSAFNGCADLRSVILNIQLRETTSISGIFSGCYNLRRAPTLDLSLSSNFGIASAFSGCTSLLDATNLPARFFEKGSSASNVFFNCSSLFSVPAELNLLRTTTIQSFFSGCSALSRLPKINAPLATNATDLALNCFALRDAPFISAPSCTTFLRAFSGCRSLQNPPTFVLSDSVGVGFSFTFENTASMRRAPVLNCTINDISGMFGYSGITEGPTLNLNLVSRSFSGSFRDCKNMVTPPTLNITGLGPTSTQNMFNNSNSMTHWNPFDMSSVTACSSMFQNCDSLAGTVNIDLSGMTTGSLGSMFGTCRSLTKVNITGHSGGSTSVASMFLNCNSLEEVDGVNLAGVSSTSNISSIFSGCVSLKRATMTGLRYGNANMLSNCFSLSRDGVVEILTSLGTAVGAQTITFPGTNYWGPAQVTAADKLIATSKGWTVAGTA